MGSIHPGRAAGRHVAGAAARATLASLLLAAGWFSGCSDSDGGSGGEGGGGTEAGAAGAAGSSAGGVAGSVPSGGNGGSLAGEAGASGAQGGGADAGAGGEAGAALGGGAGGASGGEGGASGAGGAAVGDWPVSEPPVWDGTLRTEGVCSVHGFCWSSPLNSSSNLRAVWSSSATNVWVAGAAGTLARYDGSKWSGVTSVEDPTGLDFFEFRLLRGTAGSTSNVWAVGWSFLTPDEQVFYRFDGNKWSKMTPPIYPVRDIWATGSNELWTANEGGSVSHWNGLQWSNHNVGKDISGIYGFSNTDIWVSGETVLQFNGTIWEDRGGGGPSIWGASSGDMWTGDGAHLVGAQWQPAQVSPSIAFKKVVGASATNLFFLADDDADVPAHYYKVGDTFAYSPEFSPHAAFDVWPVSASDYWVVGDRGDEFPSRTTIEHGNPAGVPQRFTASGPSFPNNPEPPYRTLGKVVQAKSGNDWVPLKTFDVAFSAVKQLAWSEDALWACSAGQLHQYAADTWTTLDGAPSCAQGWLQADGDGRLWLAQLDAAGRVYTFDGDAWTPRAALPLRYLEIMDFDVRGHEAWLLSQFEAFRFDGAAWDRYSLGVEVDESPSALCISDDEQVYVGSPLPNDSCTTQLVFRPEP